ncbi:hypothetical protein CDAR_523541 [Caerostris darwini]|uniref:Uncharacterized protein n=1 Tax=Caerostris darwini TaxID=1538125 RepID=A0AAV4VS50_9ARAC|nr:hypothetical protein CDAR_523541 [Caerostris darwini]
MEAAVGMKVRPTVTQIKGVNLLRCSVRNYGKITELLLSLEHQEIFLQNSISKRATLCWGVKKPLDSPECVTSGHCILAGRNGARAQRLWKATGRMIPSAIRDPSGFSVLQGLAREMGRKIFDLMPPHNSAEITENAAMSENSEHGKHRGHKRTTLRDCDNEVEYFSLESFSPDT